MPRGGARNNKPTALKLVTGNPGGRPLNDAEPVAPIVANIEPPKWMDVVAKRCWRDLAGELQKMGLLTVVDVNALATYCQAYSRYRAALVAMGEGSEDRQHIITLEKAEASMRLLSHDLGLNPAARSRLSVGKADKPVDEMEGLLSGRNRAS